MEAISLYGKRRIDLFRFENQAVAAHERVTVSVPVQALALGNDAAGRSFALLAEVDFSKDTTSIVLWRDSDGNRVPDAQGARMIAHIERAHGVQLSLNGETGTLYVLDRLGDRVLRIPDRTGDGIPEGDAMTTFLGPGGALGPRPRAGALGSPKRWSVFMVRRDAGFPLDSRLLTFDQTPELRRCADSTRDGICDVATRAPHPDSR